MEICRGRVKVVGIPSGVCLRLRKKRGFPEGSMENSREVTVILTGNPGDELQENRFPQQGGGGCTIVFWKSPLSYLI